MYINRKMKQEMEEVVMGVGRPECRVSGWEFKYHLTHRDLVERIMNEACEWVKRTGSTDLIRKLAAAEADVNEMEGMILAESRKYETKRNQDAVYFHAENLMMLMTILKVDGLQDYIEYGLIDLFNDTYYRVDDEDIDSFDKYKDEVPSVAQKLSEQLSFNIGIESYDDEIEEFMEKWSGYPYLLQVLYESYFADLAENYVKNYIKN